MNKARAKNLPVVAVAVVLMAGMTGLVVYSPTLYRLFCSVTGYNGTVQRVDLAEKMRVATNTPIVVSFDSNVAPDLPWEFRPEQQTITTHFGEPTQVYYYAKNNSDKTIVARAVFNVTPFAAAPFFYKTQCFCFTEEKLKPGESARLPVVFFVDEAMLDDPDAQMLKEITLSYTFYKQDDPETGKLATVRDLKSGSEKIDATLKQTQSAQFDNDAPRR